jgi:FkbM family methyltransferase
MGQPDLRWLPMSKLRLRATTVYRAATNRFPILVPIYRSVAHREPRPPFRRRFAVAALHEAIKREFGSKRRGIFLEAGANDGLLFSNTAYLERYLGWTGILVEAVPHKFVECVRNRPRSIVEHCALVGPDFKQPCVEIRYSNLMSFAPALSRIDAEKQVEIGSEFFFGQEKGLDCCTFLAPPRTLTDILRKHQCARVDLMVLDLEGAELEALKGFDWRCCEIGTILVEVRHDLPAMDSFLGQRGYERFAQVDLCDYLYRRPGPSSESRSGL